VLAIPLISGQVGQMLMGIADTVMVGKVGVAELGAAAFANTLTSVPYVLGIGLMSSVSVVVSNARGADRPEDAREALRHGTWLALGLGSVVFAVLLALLPVLHWFGQSPEVTAKSGSYLAIIAFSMIPALLSMTWKNHGDALNQPWPAFWILLGAVVLNVALNWLLIWGHWGFPAWGLDGAGVATLVARTATAVGMLIWIARSDVIAAWSRPRWFARCHAAEFSHLLRIGIPASLHLLTEVGAFASASLLIGMISAGALAAHQVALTCAATTFMLPLGIAMALTVRIGEVAGAREYPRMHRVLLGGWLYSIGFMTASAIAFLLAGRWLAHLFVTDLAVVELAAQLLVIAGIFQLFDGLQVASGGALRGIGDVKVPAMLALVSYWVIALPVGLILSRYANMGAAGVWIGLAAGLGVAAIALAVRAWRHLGAVTAQHA
jgi:MATE family multidrug resistance protein